MALGRSMLEITARGEDLVPAGPWAALHVQLSARGWELLLAPHPAL